MSNLVQFDIETQSTIPITEGTDIYCNHSSTRIMSMVAKKGDDICVWVPDGVCPFSWDNVYRGSRMPDLMQSWLDCVWVGHNCKDFDAKMWRHCIDVTPPSMIDTIELCRAANLPGSLDKACKELGVEGKFDNTSMKILCKAVVKNGRYVYPIGTIQLWNDMLSYNVQDVIAQEQLYEHIKNFADYELILANDRVNARGIPIDADAVNSLLDVWEQVDSENSKRLKLLTDGRLDRTNILSGPSLMAWLKSKGVNMASFNKEAVAELVDDPGGIIDEKLVDYCVILDVLRLRQQFSNAARGKIHRIQHELREGVMRDLHVYHKAHTGRFASRKIQIHNLPRSDVEEVNSMLDVGVEPGAVSDMADRYKVTPSQILGYCTRGLIYSPDGLCVADFASIEARVVVYLADDTNIKVYRDRQDPYLDFAPNLYGTTIAKKDPRRQVCKVVVLASGYQMGAKRLVDYAKNAGINFEHSGVTADHCIKAYRTKYARVVSMWRELQRASFDAVSAGIDSVAGKCRWFFDSGDLVCILPSGRPLVYRKAGIYREEPVWARGSGQLIEVVKYKTTYGYYKTIYGGLLAENITQAACADLLRNAIVGAETEGLRTVMHVHDEIVTLGDRGELEKLVCIMSRPPEWAASLPILVEGHVTNRYSKTGRDPIAAFNGEIV